MLTTFFCYALVNKSLAENSQRYPPPTIVMKRVAEISLAEKQNEGFIVENRTGATVNYIIPDDEANKVFDKLDGNITGVDWETETEIQEAAAHMPQLKTINKRHWQARRTMQTMTP